MKKKTQIILIMKCMKKSTIMSFYIIHKRIKIAEDSRNVFFKDFSNLLLKTLVIYCCCLLHAVKNEMQD